MLMAKVRQKVCQVWRIISTQAHSHWREKICMPNVWSQVHEVRPPGQARQTAQRESEAAPLAAVYERIYDTD